MSNVLSEEKKQQVIALGQLGWSLRRIQGVTQIRRETAAGYLKAAGIPVRAPGGWGRRPAKPAIEVSTDPVAGDRPVETDPRPGRSPSASACEPYREIIEVALAKDRNAMAIGRIWWTATVSPDDTPASSGSCTSCVDLARPKPAW